MSDVVTDPMLDTPEAVIPVGPYCYERLSEWETFADGRRGFRIKRCPFWRRGKYEPDGCCTLLGITDDDFPVIDQCKACDVNWGIDEPWWEVEEAK